MDKTKDKAVVVLLCLLAACTYGIIHDQITVRLAIEYFSVAHPPIFKTTSPTYLGLYWAIAATSGIGIGLGAILALVSQAGDTPPTPMRVIRRLLLKLLLVMALSSALAGALGYCISRLGFLSISERFGDLIPEAKTHRFVAVWFMHLASYLAGIGGGGRLCYHIWKIRGRPSVIAIGPSTPFATVRAILIFTIALGIVYIRFRSV